MNTVEARALTEKTVPELEIDAGELEILRTRICMEKQAIVGQVVEINTQLKAKILPTKDHHRLMSMRGELVKALSDKDQELAAIRARRAEVLTVRDVRKHQQFGVSDIRRLVKIRDKWHAFSMDKANPQKAREVAWKCSQDIRELLLPYFENNAP